MMMLVVAVKMIVLMVTIMLINSYVFDDGDDSVTVWLIHPWIRMIINIYIFFNKMLIILFLSYSYLRRSNAQLILCHLCIALIGLLLSFLVIANLTPNTTTCRVFSVFVHYFLLSTLAWMGVEGINMYLAFVKVMSAHVPRFMPKAVAISWGKLNINNIVFSYKC